MSRSAVVTWTIALVSGAMVLALLAVGSGDRGTSVSAGPAATATQVVADDFEGTSATPWTEVTGLQRVPRLDGNGHAARLDSRAGPAWASGHLSAPVFHATATADVRVASSPPFGAERATVLGLRTGGGATVVALTVGADGTLGLVNGFTGVRMGVPTDVDGGAWHSVGLDVLVAGADSSVTVSVDDVPVERWTTDLGDSPLGQVAIGSDTRGRGADLRVDNVAVGPAEGLVGPGPRQGHRTDPVLFAAGDIACDPKSTSFGAGSGTSSSCQMEAVADLVLADSAATTVAALGDVQYYCGGVEAFELSYDPTWGRFLDITRPAVGNHEYIDEAEDENDTECDPTGTAKPYFDYFGDRAGEYGKGYYSYDLGTWHVVVLNTTCSQAGGCHLGSPQERWLRRDLAEHPARCTLAYWHIPLWSSGGRANENSRVLTRVLYDAGADVVLTGHDHLYERFDPQDPEGEPDPRGIRAWVVGTGGANHTGVANSAANSVVVDPFSFGVLRLVLRDGSYDWTFLSANGAPFTDTGSGRCH